MSTPIPSRRLGPYELIEPIGKGGMGEVWRARDPRLGRDVAIKISAQQFSDRFEREARAIAALNHPNICTLYDVGPDYLVMELIEGPTLAGRIAEGPIPLDEALAIARHIADALEAAHEKGIVHRDLKPGNVKIAPDGTVKVLDFGLAKLPAGSSEVTADSPTLLSPATHVGMILGTAAYMAPEQARGKLVDKRADIWAFGVVLYEMLTGKQLFAGETVSDILAGVLKQEPDLNAVPVKVRPLVARCLEKDPKKRLRDIGDAWDLARAVEGGTATVPSRSGLSIGFAVLAAVSTLAAAGLAFVHFREKPPAVAEVRFEVRPPSKGNFGIYMALSPDGRHLAYTATGEDGVVRIWVRDLNNVEARPLEGTENAQSLFWSPDSRFVAFGAANELRKVDVAGGPPVVLCKSASPVGSGAWSGSGVIVFGGRGAGPLQKVSAEGGVPAPLTALDGAHGETFHSFPFFLPDGRHLVYYRQTAAAQYRGIYIGSLDASPAAQSPALLVATQFNAVYAASPTGPVGRLLFLRDGTLMSEPFDPGRLKLTGEPVPVAERVGNTNQFGNYSASINGALAFRGGSAGGESELVWVDRNGKHLETVGKPGLITFEALSPDGKTVAYVLISNQGTSDVWLYDVARGTNTRFTFASGSAVTPLWSPDGSRIVYGAGPYTGGYEIYEKPVSGAAKEQLVLRVGTNLRLSGWSPDGKTVVYDPSNAPADLWLLPMEGDHKPSPYLQTQFAEFNGQFSPDGRWMAYTSDESGRDQVDVQPIPPTGAKWQISTEGGNQARWRRDGKELFYIAADQNLVAVPVQAGASFEAGIPHALFRTPTITRLDFSEFSYTPSPDGQKFLMNVPAGSEAEGSAPITVVLNWQAGLKK